MSIDQQVESILRPLASALSDVVFYKLSLFGQDIPIIVLWLMTAAVFFTGYMGLVNIRGFSHALKIVRGQRSSSDSACASSGSLGSSSPCQIGGGVAPGPVWRSTPEQPLSALWLGKTATGIMDPAGAT